MTHSALEAPLSAEEAIGMINEAFAAETRSTAEEASAAILRRVPSNKQKPVVAMLQMCRDICDQH